MGTEAGRYSKGSFEGLLLSRKSALEFYRRSRVADELGRPYPLPAELPRSGNGRLVAEELARELMLPTPLHLTIPDEHARIRHPHGCCRLASGDELWFPICPGLGVVSPEEALFQMCEESTYLQALLHAYELCGSYAIRPSEEGGLVNDLSPLTTPQLIFEHGLDKAGNRDSPRFRLHRRMLNSLVAGAASPAEARLCLAIITPRILGGQGLPRPELNVKIEVEGDALSLTQRRVIIPDMFWREFRLILEYMGSRHAEIGRMGEDASRDNALIAMGYKVIHVTKRQVQDPVLFNGLMTMLRKELGIRQYTPSEEVAKKQETLRARLFGTAPDAWQVAC